MQGNGHKAGSVRSYARCQLLLPRSLASSNLPGNSLRSPLSPLIRMVNTTKSVAILAIDRRPALAIFDLPLISEVFPIMTGSTGNYPAAPSFPEMLVDNIDLMAKSTRVIQGWGIVEENSIVFRHMGRTGRHRRVAENAVDRTYHPAIDQHPTPRPMTVPTLVYMHLDHNIRARMAAHTFGSGE